MTEELKKEEVEEVEKEEPTETEQEETEEKEEKEILKLKEEPKFEIIDGVKYPKELIKEAKSEGWRPRDSFTKKGKYLEPDEFLKRGKEIIPFLNKKLKDKDKETEFYKKQSLTLKKLLEKQIKTQVLDKIETLDDKLSEAEEMGETKKVASITRKKVELERELKELEKEEKIEEPVQQPKVQKHPEIIKWELRNEWSEDPDNPKTIKANEIFQKVIKKAPYLDIKEALKIVDENLAEYETKNYQRKNLSAPASATKTSIAKGKVVRKIENLKSEIKSQYDKYMVGNDGIRFKGEQLRLATESFLEACDDSHFKN